MSALRELYQELIIDHGRTPRNFGHLDEANHIKQGFNPLCGDKLTIYIKETDGIIEDVKFDGEGCAISTASASLMTEGLKGKSIKQFEKLFEDFHQLVTGADHELSKKELGKLIALAGVCEYPSRVKCATLAWHTCNACIHDSEEKVTTE